MKILLKAFLLTAGLSTLLPAFGNDPAARQRAELDHKIIATAQSGDPKGALVMLGEALASDERHYGKDHTALLGRLYIQWQLLKQTGADSQQLQGLSARIGAISQAALVSQNPQRLYDTGRFYIEINDQGSAAPFFEKLLGVAEAKGDLTWQYRSLTQLGEIQSRAPYTYDKAKVTLERLIALREKHQGKVHHDLISPLRMLAKVKTTEGEPYLRRVLELERQHHEDNHPSVLRARFKLTEFHADYSTSDKALAALDDYMARIEKLDPQQSASGALIEPLLIKARVLADSKAYPDAARALQRMSAILSSLPGVRQDGLNSTLDGLLTGHRVVGSRRQSRGNDEGERLKSLAEATYQLQLAMKDLPPELSFVLKQEQFRRVSSNPPVNPLTGETSKRTTAEAMTRILRELASMRERHWPANDPVLGELRQALAQVQAQVR